MTDPPVRLRGPPAKSSLRVVRRKLVSRAVWPVSVRVCVEDIRWVKSSERGMVYHLDRIDLSPESRICFRLLSLIQFPSRIPLLLSVLQL